MNEKEVRQNWKCDACGLVTVSASGISSHWNRQRKKPNGCRGTTMSKTLEPATNPTLGGWRGSGKKNKRKKKSTFDIPRGKGMSLPLMTSSDGPLVIYPLIIRGNTVVHPGSFGIVAVQRSPEESLLETLINERD